VPDKKQLISRVRRVPHHSPRKTITHTPTQTNAESNTSRWNPRLELKLRRAKGSRETQTLVLETRAIAPSCDIPQLRNLSQFDVRTGWAEAEQMFVFRLIILYSPTTDLYYTQLESLQEVLVAYLKQNQTSTLVFERKVRHIRNNNSFHKVFNNN
jgi:hypothetical protein